MIWLNDKLPDIFKKRLFSLFAIIIVCGFQILAGCTDHDQICERVKQLATDTGPVQLAMIGDFNGPGGSMLKGMELALNEVNKSGGISGRKIQLIKKDIKNNAHDALEASQNIVDNSLVCVAVSRFTPEVGMPSAVLLQYYGLLHLCTVSSHTMITRQGFDKIFKIVPDDLKTVEFLARFCTEKGLDNIIVLQSDDEYGRYLANRFENSAKNANVTIFERLIYNVVNTHNEIRHNLELWRNHSQIGAILLLGVPEYALPVIRLIAELELKVPVLGTSALDTPNVYEAIGNETIYVRTYYNPESPRHNVKEFVQAFVREYGTAPISQTGIGYDAVKLFAWAASKTGSLDPKKLARVFHGTEHYMGLAGKIMFDKFGNFIPAKVYIKRTSGNQTAYSVHRFE